jgi:hypothetical protein
MLTLTLVQATCDRTENFLAANIEFTLVDNTWLNTCTCPTDTKNNLF